MLRVRIQLPASSLKYDDYVVDDYDCDDDDDNDASRIPSLVQKQIKVSRFAFGFVLFSKARPNG